MGSTYRTLAILSIFSLVLIIVSGIEAFAFASTLSKPIRNLTTTAEDFSNGRLGARATPEGPDELRRLADSFNQMAVHLQNNIEGLRAFVANASHELRTPLTAVKLHVDALSEGAINDPAVSTRFFSQIQDELNLMSRTVTDLLDLSRIEAGRDRSDFVMINLNELVADIGEFWQARANHGGLKLGINLADQSATIFGNEDMIRRLINNLLDNAMKNTPPGGSVDISINLQPEVKKVKLEIRDTGIGIKEEHLARIFERFYRVAPTQMRSARTAGSGLGLAIAKSIVDFHGGKIGVESQLGEGSTFWADFPLERPKYEEHKTVPRKTPA
jgi:signal transduction histidine kinase